MLQSPNLNQTIHNPRFEVPESKDLQTIISDRDFGAQKESFNLRNDYDLNVCILGQIINAQITDDCQKELLNEFTSFNMNLPNGPGPA